VLSKAVLAEGLKAFKWFALQKAFSEGFKVCDKFLKAFRRPSRSGWLCHCIILSRNQ